MLFPGSNAARDALWVTRDLLGQQTEIVWHEQSDLDGYDAVILPGGRSFGGHLRPGALARFSPVMRAVSEFAETGKPVLGIDDGFQVLLESGLLPGAMLPNKDLLFHSSHVRVLVENNKTPFTNTCKQAECLTMPIAHNHGNYYADPLTIERLERRSQVVFRYCDADGCVTASANPNGSLNNIAGICNERGNVLGMMPHPELSAEAILGSCDGIKIFESVLEHWRRGENCDRTLD